MTNAVKSRLFVELALKRIERIILMYETPVLVQVENEAIIARVVATVVA